LPAASERIEALLRKGGSGKGKEGLRTRWCNCQAHNGTGTVRRRMKEKDNMGKRKINGGCPDGDRIIG
jgi:hypothetical protein